VFDHKFRGDVDGVLDGPCHGTLPGVHVVDSFDRFTIRLVSCQVVRYVDALDDKYVAFLFNFTGCLGPQFAVGCVNLTRFQRASKGSGQSPGGR